MSPPRAEGPLPELRPCYELESFAITSGPCSRFISIRRRVRYSCAPNGPPAGPSGWRENEKAGRTEGDSRAGAGCSRWLILPARAPVRRPPQTATSRLTSLGRAPTLQPNWPPSRASATLAACAQRPSEPEGMLVAPTRGPAAQLGAVSPSAQLRPTCRPYSIEAAPASDLQNNKHPPRLAEHFPAGLGGKCRRSGRRCPGTPSVRPGVSSLPDAGGDKSMNMEASARSTSWRKAHKCLLGDLEAVWAHLYSYGAPASVFRRHVCACGGASTGALVRKAPRGRRRWLAQALTSQHQGPDDACGGRDDASGGRVACALHK